MDNTWPCWIDVEALTDAGTTAFKAVTTMFFAAGTENHIYETLINHAKGS
ncbi:MAG: hypothetical protein LBD43_01980 [Holosporales bacterium]|jgi:hypothetical protein|nr:hypothetical protein [Holosporales bacterium]